MTSPSPAGTPLSWPWRLVAWPAAAVAHALVRTLGATWRYRETNKRAFDEALASGRSVTAAFLHARTLQLLHYNSRPQHGQSARGVALLLEGAQRDPAQPYRDGEQNVGHGEREEFRERAQTVECLRRVVGSEAQQLQNVLLHKMNPEHRSEQNERGDGTQPCPRGSVRHHHIGLFAFAHP